MAHGLTGRYIPTTVPSSPLPQDQGVGEAWSADSADLFCQIPVAVYFLDPAIVDNIASWQHIFTIVVNNAAKAIGSTNINTSKKYFVANISTNRYFVKV